MGDLLSCITDKIQDGEIPNPYKPHGFPLPHYLHQKPTTTDMQKEIPILFSTPMVQAILDGRKTMTRRQMNPQPLVHNEVIKLPIAVDEYANKIKEFSKKGFTQIYTNGPLSGMIGPASKWEAGDILWVKETFTVLDYWHSDMAIQVMYEDATTRICYLTYGEWVKFMKWQEKRGIKPSLFMFKSLSRIGLEITDVRAERLHAITNEDALAEGIEVMLFKDQADGKESTLYRAYNCKEAFSGGNGFQPKDSFATLWQTINGPESWNQNPWVWVVSFKVRSTNGGRPTSNIVHQTSNI